MYLGLCLIGVIAAGVGDHRHALPVAEVETVDPVTWSAATPQLRACPDRVDHGGRRPRCCAPTRSPSRRSPAWSARPPSAGSAPRTMWCWTDRFGADKLVLALDADVADRRLRGTSSRHHAGLGRDVGLRRPQQRHRSGRDAARRDPRPATPCPTSTSSASTSSEWETPALPAVATSEVDLSQFDHLPPIYDPGLPVTPVGAAAAPTSPRSRAGGDDDWPRVA